MSHYTQQQRADKCVLSLDLAVYQTTKRERGLVGQICDRYGLSYNTVSAQINPNNDSHTLSPDIIEYVLTHAKNPSLILDAVCCAHGNAGWFELPSGNDKTEYMQNLGELGQRFGDMVNTAVNAHADAIITPDEFAELQKVYQALIGTAQALMKSAERNMEANKHDN